MTIKPFMPALDLAAAAVPQSVRIPVGPLRWLVASPQFHRWHHANHAEAYDKNFARQLPVLDYIFGTLHMLGKRYPQKYGTYEIVPRLYIKQLTFPFSAPGPPAADGQQANPD